MSSQKPSIDPERLDRLCRKHGIRRLWLYGSILDDDFGPDDDVDVLVDLKPGGTLTLRRFFAAQDALGALFGRPVDMCRRSVIEQSDGPSRRDAILGSAQQIYPVRT